MNRRAAFALPAVVAGLLGLVFAWQLFTDEDGPQVPPSARMGKPLPALEIEPLYEGEPGLYTAELRGEPFLLNIWAEWCGPCKVEHPFLMTLAGEGIPIYGIDYKDKDERARAFLEQAGNPFRRVGADRDGRSGIDLGIFGVPETFVVDAWGNIRHRHAGPLNERDLDSTIRPLLAALADEASE